jgi:hypothetical protein
MNNIIENRYVIFVRSKGSQAPVEGFVSNTWIFDVLKKAKIYSASGAGQKLAMLKRSGYDAVRIPVTIKLERS